VNCKSCVSLCYFTVLSFVYSILHLKWLFLNPFSIACHVTPINTIAAKISMHLGTRSALCLVTYIVTELVYF
jgi:hypothetical protein